MCRASNAHIDFKRRVIADAANFATFDTRSNLACIDFGSANFVEKNRAAVSHFEPVRCSSAPVKEPLR